MLVAHDGAVWLPRALRALTHQTRPPDLVIAVDTGSTDTSVQLLVETLGADAVLSAPRDLGFGAALQLGLDVVLEQAREQPGAMAPDWVWVLHDDCAPAARALELLLDTGSRSDAVGVVGPKVVDWDDPDRLLEVGLTVDRAGRRSPGVDGVERDQGQHDHRSDVLAVPSAGLLVRQDVWQELGGFDPALPLLRDDIDLCWRAQQAGHRVLLQPRAVVADAQAATRGLRTVHALRAPGRGGVARVDRQHGQHVALARCSWPVVPVLLCWMALVTATRVVLLLAAKSPGRALDEVRAFTVTALAPWRWLGSRWRSRGQRTVAQRNLAPLLTTRRAAPRRAFEVVAGWLSTGGTRDAMLLESVESGPTSQEAEPIVVQSVRWPVRLARHPLSWVVLLLGAASVLAWRRAGLGAGLLNTEALAGGELRGRTSDAGQVWHASLDVVRSAGLGTEDLASPAAVLHSAWVAGVSVLAGSGGPGASTALGLLLIPVLSALSAYLAAGAATRSRIVRAWAALAWGGAPLVTGVVSQGRVGPAVAVLLLPLVAAGLWRALGHHRSGAVTATFATALAVAVLGAVVPLLAVVAVLVAAVGVVLASGAARVRAVLLVLLPPAMLGPWLAQLVARPHLLLAGPGAVADAEPVVGPAGLQLPQAWAHLVVLPDGWPLWTVLLWLGPLLLAAAAALVRGGRQGWCCSALILLAVLGLGLAMAAPAMTLARTDQGYPLFPRLTAWAGTGALLALLSVLAAVVVASDGVPERLARHGFGWRQLLLGPVAVLAVLAPLAATGAWAWQGVPLRATPGGGLPAVAADAATGPAAVRTLVLTATASRLTYRLAGDEAAPAARDLPATSPSSTSDAGRGAVAVRRVVQSLASSDVPAQTKPGSSSAPVLALRRLGVGFLLVREPVPSTFGERLDATAGLARLGRSAGGQLWRVGASGAGADAPRRAWVQTVTGRPVAPVPVAGPHGVIDTTLPAAASKGSGGSKASGPVLMLAEPRSASRAAWLDGRRLPAVRASGPDSWRQGYQLPSEGGHLVVRTDDPRTRWWRWAQLALLGLVGLLALPVRRPSGELR